METWIALTIGFLFGAMAGATVMLVLVYWVKEMARNDESP